MELWRDIAQLKFEDFSNFLDFFREEDITVFLAYLSCYAAGFNAQQVYGELTQKGSLKLNPFSMQRKR